MRTLSSVKLELSRVYFSGKSDIYLIQTKVLAGLHKYLTKLILLFVPRMGAIFRVRGIFLNSHLEQFRLHCFGTI